MKKQTLALVVSAVSLAFSLHAQPGRTTGPNFSGSMAKLFGENSAFSATMEMDVTVSANQNMTMPGKISFDSGKSRFEMDLSEAKGTQMPPNAAAQMKAMGMDKTVMIARPDKKISYLVYPVLTAYAEVPMQDPDAAKPDSAFKIEITELGKETVDGHPCVKNKAVVTDDQGQSHESTLWNATDLKKFPIKIETTEKGHTMTMLFKDVKLSKPDAALFDAPSDFKKYDNMQTMMQAEMMKRMGGGMGMPVGHP